MDDFAHIVGEDVHFRGRSPSGERGLKFGCWCRGPWCPSRSPSGERGLKLADMVASMALDGSRSPSGERGLKLTTGKIPEYDG